MRNPGFQVRRGELPSRPLPRKGASASASIVAGAGTLVASVLFVSTVLGLAWLADSQAFAVYALAFWHYLLYALAYRYGAVPLAIFKRDAVLMKGVSLLALASSCVALPVEGLSLAVVAAGFGLNALAASVLGSDRTYYGHEVAGLPSLRVARFPYSLIAHPMLVGNMLAYGGLLLNDGFRAQWWPLAGAHVAFNLGLLLMERHVLPLRRGAVAMARPVRRRSWARGLLPSLPIALLAGGSAWVAGVPAEIAVALGFAAALYLYTLFATYVAPAPRSGATDPFRPETSP